MILRSGRFIIVVFVIIIFINSTSSCRPHKTKKKKMADTADSTPTCDASSWWLPYTPVARDVHRLSTVHHIHTARALFSKHKTAGHLLFLLWRRQRQTNIHHNKNMALLIAHKKRKKKTINKWRNKKTWSSRALSMICTTVVQRRPVPKGPTRTRWRARGVQRLRYGQILISTAGVFTPHDSTAVYPSTTIQYVAYQKKTPGYYY